MHMVGKKARKVVEISWWGGARAALAARALSCGQRGASEGL